MKRAISFRLSERIAGRLAAAARRQGVSKTAIMEAALDRFLSPNGDTGDDKALSRRLTCMTRQLGNLDRDLRMVSETVALHARYHLTIAPPLPVAELRPACVLGRDRFEIFAAQVARHVRSGTSLIMETIDRAAATQPDSFAHDPQEPAPFGVQFTGDEPSVGTTLAADEPSELCAAAREDGRNGGFRRSRIPLR
jgi:AcrR family transcriptional regulator